MGNALRMSGSEDVLELGVPSNISPVTFVAWVKRVGDRNTYSCIFSLENDPGHSTEYNELITDSDGTTLVVYDHSAGLVGTVGTLTANVWYKVAWVIGSGTTTVYFGTEGVAGVTAAFTAAMTNVSVNAFNGLGASGFTSAEWFDGALSGVRVWNAALTEAEIETEFQYDAPQRTANLLGAWLPPTVTIPTVETAIVGADLVNTLGGTPTYTIETSPTLDPQPVPLTSLADVIPPYRQPRRQDSRLAFPLAPNRTRGAVSGLLIGPVTSPMAVLARANFYDKSTAHNGCTAIFCGV